ncbi:hypothetical protein KIN20_032043 [Parelaphostrongylus tenuis]|uniref:Abnormal cell migration protein 18-like fibronectin type I domain-containing protein n=1 Tax=Parelaphostrongylus tenuis TaxID=148309 RepID=A0AAD5R6E0_PARTN|nr:hypothetical protein KIN20_032043 [Parelaphostrongylus tenuis]
MLITFFILPLFANALDPIETRSSFVPVVRNLSDVNNMLDFLPKECTKNGKTYKEGEEFQIGSLRYKCQKYGVYSIEGCVTGKKKNLKIGEVVVIDNVKSQCLAKGDSVFFKETVCGMMGQPDCDKIPLPTGFQEAVKAEDTRSKEKEISVPGLPPGWKMVNETRQKISNSSEGHFISRTLVFHPIIQHSRIRRQHSKGVGSLVSSEELVTVSSILGRKSSSLENNRFVQSVSQKLNTLNKGGGRIVGHGTGIRDLGDGASRVPNTAFKPGTLSGSRSDVSWSGKNHFCERPDHRSRTWHFHVRQLTDWWCLFEKKTVTSLIIVFEVSL